MYNYEIFNMLRNGEVIRGVESIIISSNSEMAV